MSYPTNKTAIGAFVAVFATLLVIAVIFFGKFSLTRDKAQFVIYFEDSLNGLDIGSAVKFKGVKVGSVKSIKMNFANRELSDLAVPVVIEVDYSKESISASEFKQDRLEAAIREGLRARLQLTSVVTGLLYVDLDFIPNSPIILHGNPPGITTPEIPALPSNTAQMMKAVSTILEDLSSANIAGLSAQLQQTAIELKHGLSQIEFKKINDNVVRLTDSAASILEDPELKTLVTNLNRLVVEIDALSTSVAGQVDPLANEIKTSLTELKTTLTEISETVVAVQSSMTPGQGSIGQEFHAALIQINEAARAVRALADYLQVNLVSDEPVAPTKIQKK